MFRYRLFQTVVLNEFNSSNCIWKNQQPFIANLFRHKSSSCSSQQLVVRKYGDPQKVVELETVPIPKITSGNQILVRIEASTVNPGDINTIQGVYAIKPDFPFVPGNEAVMTVVATGKDVQQLREGDKVIPCTNTMGTWRNYALVQEKEIIKIPSHIDNATAASISVNPCTAYRMLLDFVSLKEGDVVIQNCANSAVGQAVIQIAASRGIQTINIVRDRPELQQLTSFLKNLGANLVITDTELRSTAELSKFAKPKLALNGVSGKPATEMLRKLDVGATMVTYGGMSKQPVIIPVGSLIFNDLIFRGFWMTRWYKLHPKDESRMQMLQHLFQMVDEDKFKTAHHSLVPVTNYKDALRDAMPANGKLGVKQILSFQ